MFVLRIIEETRENEQTPFHQVIENFELGNSYSILKKGITKEFDEVMKRIYPDKKTEDVSALLCTETGKEFFIENYNPLRQYSYFVMNENGKTFERL
jgi:hypothetical protein